ncbi:microtubule-associated proteins 70-5 [Actinidia rufa]|uniref:Microtubule-associated proteins 70-5 n=1 Tax=Actinidia rufa TaxID=165716 RepID=A0A7J0F0C9_9ERIC|nr:microtubule-associated proteins 70-5 [Actinidia rufa]
MLGMEELGEEELSLAQPDPVVSELNRLQNQLKEKDRELGGAQNEIKALKATEVLKDKAIEKLTNEFNKLDGKLRFTENLLEQKNLDIKKLTSERKEALAAQFAAEATLRRVHANQKDDDSVPIESVIAPLEADIKMYRNEILALQEDKKAMERLTKSKEVALLEAEKILRSALERALIVEEEENRILDKTNRQKVLEVEKLTQTIKELEEAILAGGAAANATRDYQRQISELHEEKRTLERELARVKVSANRVATVVANEWKGENDKVMPVKQWLDERRLLQAEMQRLRDKLVVSERTAKAEAQHKDKLKLRLKTLEEGFKKVSTFSTKPSAFLWTAVKKENKEMNGNTIRSFDNLKDNEAAIPRDIKTKSEGNEESQKKGDNSDDTVSGFLYDRLQKEVIAMRRFCEVKDSTLTAKDEEIKVKYHQVPPLFVSSSLDIEYMRRLYCQVLMKKVYTLTKAIEVESKKLKREAVTKEKESVSAKMDDNKKIRNATPSKRSIYISSFRKPWGPFPMLL